MSKPKLILMGQPYTAERIALFYEKLTGKKTTPAGMKAFEAAAKELQAEIDAQAQSDNSPSDRPGSALI